MKTMGADIYLETVNSKARDEWEPRFRAAVAKRDAYRGTDPAIRERLQKPVDEAYEGMFGKGYFRDSYNPTSLFWLLGLSWWEDVPMLKKRPGYLGMKAAKALLQKLETDLQVTDERFAEWEKTQRARGDTVFDDKDDSPEAWKAMFLRKHADLCALLRQSIEIGEPLRCSV
jgi:hypothetical protein